MYFGGFKSGFTVLAQQLPNSKSSMTMELTESVSRPLSDDHEESGFESFLSGEDIRVKQDWRKNLKSVRNKLGHILDTDDIPKDVRFLVGTDENNAEIISAHKFLLRLSSPVFESLMQTHIEPDTCNDGNAYGAYFIHDTEPEAFKHLLKFLYTDEIDIHEADSNVVISLLDLVEKYKIDNLAEICCKRLQGSITTENAVHYLNIASKIQHDDLFEFVLDFILRNGTEILESSSFLEVIYENACFILQEDGLVATELTIFRAVFRWAQKRCEIEKRPQSPQNIRMMMGDILYLVRFPLMKPDEFVINVMSTGILESKENTEILQYISVSDSLKPNLSPVHFSCQARLGLSNPELVTASSTFSNGLNSCMDDERGFSCLKKSGTKSTQLVIRNGSVDFMNFLKKCSNLHYKLRHKIDTISLENVKLTCFDEHGIQYIRFPNLKVFHLQTTCPKEHDEEFKMIDLLRSHFGRFLFFTKKAKHYPWPWPLAFIWSLNVNILISLNGLVFLNVNHESQSLVFNQLDQVCSVLEGLKVSNEVRRFSIAFKSPISELLLKPNLSPVPFLEVLTLHFAYHIQNITQYVNLFPNLVELTLVKCEYRPIQLDKAVSSPEKLTKLSIHQAKIEFLHYGTSHYRALEQIFLWNCLWDIGFEEHFISTFPNLRVVHLYNSFVNKPLYEVLNKVRKLEHVEEIIISGCFWGNLSPGIQMKKDDNSRTEMELFLKQAGVRRHFYPSFGLKKRYVDNVNESESFKWVARKLMEDEVSEAVFKPFQFNRFYTDLDAFKTRFPQDY